MTGNQKSFEKLMNQGHSAAWDQNWGQAAAYYQQALEEFPNHPTALASLGLALYEMRDYKEAFPIYMRAAKAAPEDPLPLEKIARIYETQGKKNDAVQVYMKAAELHLKSRNVEKAVENWKYVISLQPGHIMARTRLAMVYERTGRKNEAVTEYLATASLLQNSGDVGKAVQITEYCLQIMPDSIEARHALSLLHSNQPLPKPVKPKVEPVGVPIPPLSTGQLKAPAPSSVKQQDPISEARQIALVELAELLFEQAEEIDDPTRQPVMREPDPLKRGTGSLTLGQGEKTRILMHLGQAIESQSHGDNNQAAEELERAIDVGMSHPAGFFDLGLLRLERNPQRAVRYLQRSVKAPQYALASYLLMAGSSEKEGNYDEAAQAYLHALCMADMQTVPSGRDEELRQLYEPIFEEFSHQKDLTALKKLCQTISSQLLRPDWRNYLIKARQQLSDQSGGANVLPLAEMLLQTNSSQLIEALSQVRQLMDRKLYYSAMEEAFRSMDIAPTYLPLHTQMGEILVREGFIEEAVAKFLLVAEVYNLRGEAGQAVKLLARVVQMAPMNIRVRNYLIDLLIAQGRTDEAIQQYMDLANQYYYLTELENARNTLTSALRLSQQSLVDRSWSVQILNKIADIDMQRLELRQALRIYEQVRTLEPEDDRARTNLIILNFRLGQDATALSEVDGYIALLEHKAKRAQAIQFVKNLLTEYPNRPELLKRLAELYARNGQKAEAIQQLDTLADLLLSNGNIPGAIAMIRSIISLNPPNVADYQMVLKQLETEKK